MHTQLIIPFHYVRWSFTFKVCAAAKLRDSLVFGLLLSVFVFADCLWKKPFSPLNVKVSVRCPCHPSQRQKVRDKLSSNGQRQTKERLT